MHFVDVVKPFLQRAESLVENGECRVSGSTYKIDLLIFLFIQDGFPVKKLPINWHISPTIDECYKPLGDVLNRLVHLADHEAIAQIPAQEICM